MITRYKTVGLLTLFLIFSLRAAAFTVIGGDITWKQLSGDTFEVYLTIHSDCNGIPSGLTPALQVTNLLNNTSTSVSFTSSTTEDVTPVCENACTRCSDPGCTDTRFGIKRQVFTTKVVLDRNVCCKWRFSYGKCCLPNAISFIPTDTDFYIESWLDLCNVPGPNSSPKFLKEALLVIPKEVCLQTSLAASDEQSHDGDEDILTYKLIKPISANNTPITYSTGFSYDLPFTYTGKKPNDPWSPDCNGFHFDTATAELRVKAAKEDKTLLSYEVEEWRKDSTGTLKKISSVRRMTAVFVEDVNSETLPSVLIPDNKISYVFCAGREYRIPISSYSFDGDSIYLNRIDEIGGAKFNINPKKQQHGVLNWTPALTDVRDEPYYFIVNVAKTNCPYPISTDITFSITVIDSVAPVYFKVDTLPGLRRFKFTPDSINTNFKYLWNFGDGDTSTSLYPEHVYAKDDEYYPKLTISYPEGCDASVMERIVIAQCISNSKPEVKLPANEQVYFVCANEQLCIPITATDGDSLSDSISLSVDNHIMSWPGAQLNEQQAPGKTSGTFCWQPDTSFISDDPHYIRIFATDSHDPCHDKDSILIKVFVTPPVNADFTATEYVINPQTYYFAPADLSFLEYEWDFGDGTTSTLFKPTHTYTKDSTYTVTLTVISGSGCTATMAKNIKVKSCQSNSAPAFASDNGKYDYSICAGDLICIPVSAQDPDSGDVISLTWNKGTTRGTFTKPAAGKGEFCWQTSATDGSSSTYSFSISAADKCQTGKTLNFTVKVNELPDADFTIQPAGGLAFAFFPNVSAYTKYNWSFGDGDTSADIQPVHSYDSAGTYIVKLTVTDSIGCFSSYSASHTITLTGLEAKSKASTWKIYPNPVQGDKLILESSKVIEGKIKIELYDLSGKEILQAETNRQRTELKLPHDMKPGSYMLRIIGKDSYSTEVIVR